MKQLKATIRKVMQRFGVDLIPYDRTGSVYPRDFRADNIEICNAIRPFTLTSKARQNALIDSVRYIVANEISGAIVECGVWKGGSMMAVALTLQKLGDVDRELYLYDTYAGMTAPTQEDICLTGVHALDVFSKLKTTGASTYLAVSVEEVRKNVLSTGYPKEKIHFIKGNVEDTIPSTMPSDIALLRLDTDWYASTKHEMQHLFPLLKQHGVLILDDYGHWGGSQQAVDEYLAERELHILLNRVDGAGRVAIKT